jgi:hypothetical protein
MAFAILLPSLASGAGNGAHFIRMLAIPPDIATLGLGTLSLRPHRGEPAPKLITRR